jgi:hypothetical protein
LLAVLLDELALLAVRVRAMSRLTTRRIRTRRDRALGIFVVGTVLVRLPARAPSATVDRPSAAELGDLVMREASRRLGVARPIGHPYLLEDLEESPGPLPGDERGAEQTLPPLYRYGWVQARPGLEEDLVRGIHVLGRRLGLPRDGLEAVKAARSVWGRPEASATSVGAAITWSGFYRDWVRRSNVRQAPKHGWNLKVFVLDYDPDPGHLLKRPDGASGRSVHLGSYEFIPGDPAIFHPGARRNVHAHGTLVTAIVADLAPNATIHTIGIFDPASVDTHNQPVLDAKDLEAALWRCRYEADVINLSVSFPRNPRSPMLAKSNALLADFFHDIYRQHPLRPIIVCPTGNYRKRLAQFDPIDMIAVPACFEWVVAVGSVTSQDCRAANSRYGRKDSGEEFFWWLAPGGGRREEGGEEGGVESVATVNGSDLSGTSFATAFATGLIALALAEQDTARTSKAAPRDQALADLLDQLERMIGSSEEDLKKVTGLRHALTHGSTRAKVLAALNSIPLPNHEALKHGRGIIALPSSTTST